MGGKADSTGVTTGPATGSKLFGTDDRKALGTGIQQASQNFLQQQAANGDPNAAGIAQGSAALGGGIAKKFAPQPYDMTNQVNMPNVITSPMNGPTPPPPNLFVPSGNPITSPMGNPGTGMTMQPPITSPMNPGMGNPGTGMPMFQTPGVAPQLAPQRQLSTPAAGPNYSLPTRPGSPVKLFS